MKLSPKSRTNELNKIQEDKKLDEVYNSLSLQDKRKLDQLPPEEQKEKLKQIQVLNFSS